MDQSKKIVFLRDAIRRMAESTLPYIASIIGARDSQHGEHIGTAFRCLLGGRKCLVTAHHVIAHAVRDFPGRVTISAGYGAKPYHFEGPVRFDRLTDLAVLPLPQDYPDDRSDVAFWSEDRIDRSTEARPNDYLFLHGFPYFGSEKAPGRVDSKSLPYGAMEIIGNDRPGVLQRFQFPLYFSASEMFAEAGSGVELLNAQGLSGSPVWRIGANVGSASTWTPDLACLVGIITQWGNGEPHQGREFLAATEASALFKIEIDDLSAVR